MQRPRRFCLPRVGLVCRWREFGVLVYRENWRWDEPVVASFSYLGTPLPRGWRGMTLGARWLEMKKPTGSGEEGSGKPHALVPESMKALLPEISAMMADGQYEDGTPKGPGSLHIEPFMGRWQVRAKIRGSGLMIQIAAADPESAVIALEAALASGEPPWEHDPFGGMNGKKKKK